MLCCAEFPKPEAFTNRTFQVNKATEAQKQHKKIQDWDDGNIALVEKGKKPKPLIKTKKDALL